MQGFPSRPGNWSQASTGTSAPARGVSSHAVGDCKDHTEVFGAETAGRAINDEVTILVFFPFQPRVRPGTDIRRPTKRHVPINPLILTVQTLVPVGLNLPLLEADQGCSERMLGQGD